MKKEEIPGLFKIYFCNKDKETISFDGKIYGKKDMAIQAEEVYCKTAEDARTYFETHVANMVFSVAKELNIDVPELVKKEYNEFIQKTNILTSKHYSDNYSYNRRFYQFLGQTFCKECKMSVAPKLKVKSQYANVGNYLLEHYSPSTALFDIDDNKESKERESMFEGYFCPCCDKKLVFELSSTSFCRPATTTLFVDENKVKLTTYFEAFEIFNPQSKQAIKPSYREYRESLIFNVKNGLTYILPMVKKKNNIYPKINVKNCTYRSYAEKEPAVTPEILLIVLNQIAESNNIDVSFLLKKFENTYFSCNIEKCTLDEDAEDLLRKNEELLNKIKGNNKDQEKFKTRDLKMINKSVFFNPGKENDELIAIFQNLKYRNYTSARRNMLRVYRKFGNAIAGKNRNDLNAILSLLNLPNTKAYRKIAANSYIALCNVKIAQMLGFKDINVIKRLIDKNILKKCFSSEFEKIKSFATVLIKEKGEVFAANCMFSNEKTNNSFRKTNYIYSNWEIFVDAAMMYEKLIVTYSMDNVNKLLSGNIKEIHDKLMIEVNKQKYKNIPIEYSKREKKLEANMDGLSFELAKDTNALVDCGQQMHICVGSYRDKVLNKCATIVFLKENEKYIGCIELVVKQKDKDLHLCQAKAFANNGLYGSYAKALIAWCENNHIVTNNCSDYTYAINHINQTQLSTKRTLDYHRLELVDGNVVMQRDMFNDALPFV